MFTEARNDFDPGHAFVREEFDNVALLHFHIFGSFAPIETLLPA
jgi:hypothetical protein